MTQITHGTFTSRRLCKAEFDVETHDGQLWHIIPKTLMSEAEHALYAQGYRYCLLPRRGVYCWIVVIDAAP